MLTKKQIRSLKPPRHARKIADGRGLHLLPAANGGKYWRYDYRFEDKRNA